MIISASRRTDIPAFYPGWFVERIREGCVLVHNPINPKITRKVSLLPSDVDCIVFWTKNPGPFLDKLPLLDRYNYYFQFTVTPYDRHIEPGLGSKELIVDIFKRLSRVAGKERIVWRYDPILLTEEINVDYHKAHFKRFAREFSGYTSRCVISFLDMYKKCEKRMKELKLITLTEEKMKEIAAFFSDIASGAGIEISTCAEKIDLSALGINHGKCIDDKLVSEISGRNTSPGKDRSQRKECFCAESVDIGDYNTCRHGCIYCYATKTPPLVK